MTLDRKNETYSRLMQMIVNNDSMSKDLYDPTLKLDLFNYKELKKLRNFTNETINS